MIFWRPAQEMRCAHGFWWNSKLLMASELGGLAARLVYRHFCIMPAALVSDNDRDRLKW